MIQALPFQENETLITRAWAMPNAETFAIPPIADLLQRRLKGRQVIVDPFARGSRWGTVTNDLDPSQPTQFHMDATEFCKALLRDGCAADAALFDPPYSPRQISEAYKAVGLASGMAETQNGRFYKSVRDGLDELLSHGGVVVSCGWNSNGMGKTRGYALVEVLLVAHGGAHNDTIVTVEIKL